MLSTHTAGFTGFTVRDLSDDMPAIKNHWLKEGIRYTATLDNHWYGAAFEPVLGKLINALN